MNYYNEIDPYCVQWLENLISEGLIPDGDVDDRPIQEVQAKDVEKYTQCHFFAGIGGWPYALELAGWGADRPVWTGSCPCQPFSAAGIHGGHKMNRYIIIGIIIAAILLGWVYYAGAAQFVPGYTRSDGRYVQGHFRTAPNNTRRDNYSHPGNYNPNSGTRTPERRRPQLRMGPSGQSKVCPYYSWGC